MQKLCRTRFWPQRRAPGLELDILSTDRFRFLEFLGWELKYITSLPLAGKLRGLSPSTPPPPPPGSNAYARMQTETSRRHHTKRKDVAETKPSKLLGSSCGWDGMDLSWTDKIQLIIWMAARLWIAMGFLRNTEHNDLLVEPMHIFSDFSIGKLTAADNQNEKNNIHSD